MEQKKSAVKIADLQFLDGIKDAKLAAIVDELWKENQKLQSEIEFLEEDRDYLRGSLGAYIVIANKKDDCMIEMERSIDRYEEQISQYAEKKEELEKTICQYENTVAKYENTVAKYEETIRQYESTMEQMDRKIKMFEGSRYYRFRKWISRVIHGIGRRVKRLFGKKRTD